MDAKIMALNALRRVGSASTGGEIWKFLNDTCENYEDRKFLKSNFPAEDQNIREILTELVKKGLAINSNLRPIGPPIILILGHILAIED
jgi:hypothetical protein